MRELGLALILSLFLTPIASLAAGPHSSSAASPAKSAVLKSLQLWRERIIAEDEATISAQKKQIELLAKVSLKRDRSELDGPLLEIERLDNERMEFEARRRIIDQLIFSVDTKWNGAELKGFIETQLLELTLNDLAEPGHGGWWKFLVQASISLRETAEPGADPIKYLDQYMAESSVLDPKSAFEMTKTRNYVGD